MSARKISQRIKDNPHPIDTTGLPLLLDETQASKVLGVSLSYLRKSRNEGTRKDRTPAPQHVKVNGRCLYPLRACLAWIDELMDRGVA